ncbi:hypothetical protein Syun_024431 [Stephania yunnanensis]|uniref:DNA 3'-5' helicase n=1 Tax=Stephania yunnanensis TaxID=152371 RepID=A0AAP0I4F5_9MAGN
MKTFQKLTSLASRLLFASASPPNLPCKLGPARCSEHAKSRDPFGSDDVDTARLNPRIACLHCCRADEDEEHENERERRARDLTNSNMFDMHSSCFVDEPRDEGVRYITRAHAECVLDLGCRICQWEAIQIQMDLTSLQLRQEIQSLQKTLCKFFSLRTKPDLKLGTKTKAKIESSEENVELKPSCSGKNAETNPSRSSSLSNLSAFSVPIRGPYDGNPEATLPDLIESVVCSNDRAEGLEQFGESVTRNEGNFVRLNINGYGNKFKFKNRRGHTLKRYGDRRSRWRSKGKFRKEGKAEGEDGLLDEDGLVSETAQVKTTKGRSKCNDELIEQAVLACREDPSDGNLKKLLKLTHGYDSFREGQLEAIKQVIDGKSTMLVLPTGAGKSLCYQLPAMILPGLTLVISPLVALMVDQLRQLPPMIPGGLLCSSQTSEENSATVQQLLEGSIKVLFVSPERFLNANFISIVGATPLISLVVVDEAHCLSEWSHNFRPSYLRLRASLLQSKLKVECFLAMTATATSRTLHAIMCALDIPLQNLIQTTQIRENLQLSVTLSGNRQVYFFIISWNLLTLMISPPFSEVQSFIIYCKFQSEADTLAKYLCDKNISAKSYHGGFLAKERNRTQELFCSNKIRVVVATVAFGMGLDKTDVGAVIHYSLPESLEEYVQEIGRAGRDGRLAYCHLFIDDGTYFKLRSFCYSDGVDEHAVNKFLSHVFGDGVNSHGKVHSIVKESASRKFDIKEEVMLTMLTYLELGEVQYLRLLPQQSVTCTLHFHRTSPDLLARTNVVVSQILRCESKTFQGAYVFDIPTVANSVGISAVDLSNQLHKLKSMGEITYELKDAAFCYMIVKGPEDFCSLVADVIRWLSEVENCKVRKLNIMFNAATFASKECDRTNGCSGTLHTQCLQSRILDYFGRDDGDNCDFTNKTGQSSPFLRADIKVFLQSNSHVKFTPRAVARIMHGIPSPAFPSSTWFNTHFWGRYSQIDFPIVMEAATAELMNFTGKHHGYQ